MCKGHCIKGSETISIKLETGKGKYNFPTSITADGKDIKAIAIRRNQNTAKDAYGRTLAPDTVLSTAHLNLAQHGQHRCNTNLPLDFLTYDDSMFTCLEVNKWDANNSELTLDPNATGFFDGDVVEFTLFYDCAIIC